MKDFEYDYEIEMPTSCQKCGRIFELNTGCASNKWYPNTTICVECGIDEDREIEEDEIIEDANIELSNALFDFKDRGWQKVSNDNKELIMQLINNCKK
jgi:hypothetical protein